MELCSSLARYRAWGVRAWGLGLNVVVSIFQYSIISFSPFVTQDYLLRSCSP